MNTELAQKIMQFDRAINFREVGRLMTADGLMMKPGKLFRSDDLSHLSKRDQTRFSELDIKLIFDLRTEKERKSKPHQILGKSGIRIVHIPMQDEKHVFTGMELLRFLFGDLRKMDFDTFKRQFYHSMAHERINQIGQILTLLTDRNNLPAVIHCTSGMDRTGFISAIIQLLVGVPYQTVLSEYLLSNGLLQKRMQRLGKYIKWLSLFQLTPERLRPIFEVRSEYLNEIFDGILQKYGSIEKYVSAANNFNKNAIANLKQLLCEDKQGGTLSVI